MTSHLLARGLFPHLAITQTSRPPSHHARLLTVRWEVANRSVSVTRLRFPECNLAAEQLAERAAFCLST